MNDLVRGIFPSHALYNKQRFKSVFHVNLFHPGKETLPRIRQIILQKVKNMEEDRILCLPPSFVLFDYEAMVYVKELKEKGERKVDVLKLEECVQIGERLGMEETTVKAALTYFHKNNIFLFFKEMSSGIAFLDPKILIRFVNALVRFSYIYIDGNRDGDEDTLLPVLTESEIQSLSNGIITEGLLKNSYLADNFVPGLFEASHAIEIFKKLYTIAEQPQKPGREPKYLMMCLLPRLSPDEFKTWRNSLLTMNPKPLCLDFGVDQPPDWELCCSPSGSFGNTIACLMSKYSWKTVDYEEPACLYHNMAMLRPSQTSLEVTLLDKTQYFEVYVNDADEQECEFLQEVRSQIVSAVREVLEKMLKVAEGFECTCGQGKQHKQYLTNGSTKYLECAICVNGCKKSPESFWVKKQGMFLQYILLHNLITDFHRFNIRIEE